MDKNFVCLEIQVHDVILHETIENTRFVNGRIGIFTAIAGNESDVMLAVQPEVEFA